MVPGLGPYLAAEDVRLIPRSENMTMCDDAIKISIQSAASGEMMTEVYISPLSNVGRLCEEIVANLVDDDALRSKESHLALIFKDRRLSQTAMLRDVGVSSGDIVQCLKIAAPPPTAESAQAHRDNCRCRGHCDFLNLPGGGFNECCVDACKQHPPKPTHLGLGYYPCQACWDRRDCSTSGRCVVEGCSNHGNSACAGRCHACSGWF